MPREDRLRGTPFERLSHGEAASFGGPDHDGLTGEKREGIFVPRETVRQWKNRVDQLNALTEKLMIALGDITTMDTLTGDPDLLVDRIIAERDGLKIINKALLKERDALALDKASRDGLISDLQAEVARLRRHGEDYIKALLSERDDLKTTLRAATEELVRLNDELTEAHAEVKRLQGQLPSPPVHEIEILSELTTEDGWTDIQVKCPYPDCDYEAAIRAPSAGLAHRMADALAMSHEQEMEEDPDAEG